LSPASRNHAIAAFALSSAALVAASALGQTPLPPGTARVEPNTAGKPSKLIVDLTPPASQPTPTAAVLAITRGFRIDRRARKRRCSSTQASNFSCPAKSRIGRGSAQITAKSALFGSQTYTATLDFFLAPPPQAGDKAGVVVQANEPTFNIRRSSTARLVKLGGSGPFGYELRSDTFPIPQNLPAGITVHLDRLQFKIAAKRKVKKVKRKANGRKVVKRRRYYLIRNPKTCPGSWPYEVRLTLPSGQQTYTGQLTCT
jgi:hypothetical protein